MGKKTVPPKTNATAAKMKKGKNGKKGSKKSSHKATTVLSCVPSDSALRNLGLRKRVLAMRADLFPILREEYRKFLTPIIIRSLAMMRLARAKVLSAAHLQRPLELAGCRLFA